MIQKDRVFSHDQPIGNHMALKEGWCFHISSIPGYFFWGDHWENAQNKWENAQKIGNMLT